MHREDAAFFDSAAPIRCFVWENPPTVGPQAPEKLRYLFNRGAAGFRGTGPNTDEANDLFSSAWGAATDPGFWASLGPLGELVGGPEALVEEASASVYDKLVADAQALYPGKAGNIEYHHITPKYLGGDPAGPTVPLDGAYHQVITNAFRQAYPYGQSVPSASDLQTIMNRVYTQYPLGP